jgi:hypothetical protein
MKNLKISEIHLYPEILVEKLKSVISKNDVQRLVNEIEYGNWQPIYNDLLKRLKFYVDNGVFEYSEKELNTLIANINVYGAAFLADKLVAKNFGVWEQLSDDIRDANFNSSEISELINRLKQSKFSQVLFAYVDEESEFSTNEISVTPGSIVLIGTDNTSPDDVINADFVMDLRDVVVSKQSLINLLMMSNDISCKFDFDGNGDFQLIQGDFFDETESESMVNEVYDSLLDDGFTIEEITNELIENKCLTLGYENFSEKIVDTIRQNIIQNTESELFKENYNLVSDIIDLQKFNGILDLLSDIVANSLTYGGGTQDSIMDDIFNIVEENLDDLIFKQYPGFELEEYQKELLRDSFIKIIAEGYLDSI